VQAALVSAASFALAGLLPIAALLLTPAAWHVAAVVGSALVSLAILGGLGGRLGGAPLLRAAVRAVVGGAFAMIVTALVGRLVGSVAAG
jgi:VIT1/CCC1 family predicted Fe2+/Mn2+ transporter